MQRGWGLGSKLPSRLAMNSFFTIFGLLLNQHDTVSGSTTFSKSLHSYLFATSEKPLTASRAFLGFKLQLFTKIAIQTIQLPLMLFLSKEKGN